MDRHVASLLAMTIRKWFIAPITEWLGVRSSSRNDKKGIRRVFTQSVTLVGTSVSEWNCGIAG
jgi:hypothetical protein